MHRLVRHRLLLAFIASALGCQAKPIPTVSAPPPSRPTVQGLACHPSVTQGQVLLSSDIAPVWSRSNNGGERTVFPDAPTRAYRIGKDVCIHISHNVNSRVCGPSLTELERPSQVIFRSPENRTSPLFDYHTWLFSPYALNDRSLIALAHSEWYDCLKFPANSPLACANGNNRTNSWSNAVTAYRSDNGGASWARTGIVESIGDYPPNFERIWPKKMIHFGFFHPSNIVREGNRYYAFVRYAHRNADSAAINSYGMILISTTDPYSAQWEQMTPKGHFAVQAHHGIVLPGTSNWDHLSVTWNGSMCQYLILFWDYSRQRLMSTTTPSLAHPLFSPPQEVQNQMSLQVPGNDNKGLLDANYATAQLDPDSTSRNFETTDTDFFIFLSSFTRKDVSDRNVFRVNAKVVSAAAIPAASTTLLSKAIFKYQSKYYYSNGLGHYCAFRSRAEGERVSRQHVSNVETIAIMPDAMVLDGVCGGG